MYILGKDLENLKATIEELLYENAEDFKIAKVIKQEIKSYFKNLEETFANSSGKDFLVKHTRKIDNILKLIYTVAQREMFGQYTPMKNSIPIALVALGSYGREQLCVYSDIDLMLVYKKVPGYNSEKMIEKILYILWDTGLKLGHRVHSTDELLEISRTDITIKTALIESRFIEGSNFVWTDTQNAIRQIRHDDPKTFINKKILEQSNKHRKYPLTMEPNIKDGVGGFRDANLVFWIGKVLYNSDNIKNLPLVVVTEKEYREFRIALEFLFRVRSALHLVSGKKEDNLRLDLMPDVSKLLGYEQNNNAHRKFAQKVIGSLKVIRLYSIIWLNILTKDYIDKKDNNIIYPSNGKKDLNALVKELNSYANRPFKADASFLQRLIHAEKPEAPNSKYYINIKKIFYQKYSYNILNTLSYARQLRYLIPSIQKVIDLPQFDGYHQYAVDIHSLKSVKYLENIQEPFIKDLFDSLCTDDKALIKIVTLLHDAGKGREKDHHIVGTTLFKAFARSIELKQELLEDGATLILYHSKMSEIAQREDLHNEKTILKFASYFKSKRLLNLIYILTYADMSGVGADIYNAYSAKLLKTLYLSAVESLEHKKALNDTAKRVKKENALKKKNNFLELKRSEQKKILQIPSNLLFIRYNCDEILTICKKAFSVKNYTYTLSNSTYLTIEIIRRDTLNLGYLLAKLSKLEVVNMDIFKLFDGMKYFKIDFKERVNHDDLQDINKIIDDSFKASKRSLLKQPSIKSNEIITDCEHSKTHGALYLNTKDQKGLLAFIIDVFDELNMDIASAKIHTIKNRTRDTFLIEKDGNFCQNKDIIIEKLTKVKNEDK